MRQLMLDHVCAIYHFALHGRGCRTKAISWKAYAVLTIEAHELNFRLSVVAVMHSFGLRWFRKKQPTLPVWVLSSRCDSASCLDRGMMCGPRISYIQPELAILVDPDRTRATSPCGALRCEGR